MLLPEKINALLPAVAKKKENVYAMDHLKITDTHTYSSNGHCAYRINMKDTKIPEDYPDHQLYTELSLPSYIPGVMLHKAFKNLPKFTPLNILRRIIAEDGKLTTIDLDSCNIVKYKVKEIFYPDIERIFESTQESEDSISVTLCRENLETLLKVMKVSKSDDVKITVTSSLLPVVVKIDDDIDGIIMTMSE